MYKSVYLILIWSEDYSKLSQWYVEKLGFKIISELNFDNDTGVKLVLGDGKEGVGLWIGQHSEIHGKNKDPLRIMFNIAVDSVNRAYQDLASKSVNFIAKPFEAPTGKWFATFEDLDGNVIQVAGGE